MCVLCVPETLSCCLCAAQVDLKHAMCSLSALIKYLEVSCSRLPVSHFKDCMSILFVQLLSDESNFGAYRLATFDFTQYLRLDSAAVRALHLDAQPGDSSTTHLYGILNNCLSAQGRRLLQQWLRQPLLDKNKIGIINMYVFTLGVIPLTVCRRAS